jgi:uncharacterized protein (DUF983 family)
MTRSIKQSMWRGFNTRCPDCGKGHLMAGYITVAPACTHCGEDFSHQRADDAPPYFTIMAVGHLVIPALWFVERFYAPPMLPQLILWPLLITVLSLWLLPRVKGAIVGLQWATRMHGFGGEIETAQKP